MASAGRRDRPSRERRREARRAATGDVFLETDTLGREPVRARLIDISDHGFRVAHGFPGFRSGEEVRFRHQWGSGRARVVWNLAVGDDWESGFFVVRSDL